MMIERQFAVVHNQLFNKPLTSNSTFYNLVTDLALKALAFIVYIPSAILCGLGWTARKISFSESNKISVDPRLHIHASVITPPSVIETSAGLPAIGSGIEISIAVPNLNEGDVKHAVATFKDDDRFIRAEEAEVRKDIENRYSEGLEDRHLALLISMREKNLASLPTDAPPINLVTIGAGPSGLVASIQAYLAGANVTLIESRADFTRDQILRLNADTYGYIANIFGPTMIKNLEALEVFSSRYQGQGLRGLFTESKYWVTEIKDLQFVLFALLKRLQVLDNQKQPSLSILTQEEFIKIEDGSVFYKNKQTQQVQSVKAEWICGADGANSKVAAAAGFQPEIISSTDTYIAATFNHLHPFAETRTTMEFNADPNIPALPQVVLDGIADIRQSSSCAETEEHLRIIEKVRVRTWIDAEEGINNNNIAAHLHTEWRARLSALSPKCQQTDLDTVRRGSAIHLKRLKGEWNWSKGRRPVTRFFTSPKTIYMGCEIPSHMLETMQKDRKEAFRWVKAVLRAHLPENTIQSLTERNISAFPVHLNRKTEFYKNLDAPNQGDLKEQTAKVFLIGDALATPHFLTGSGAIAGMKVARLFAELIGNVQSNRAKESCFLKAYVNEVSKVITAMQNKPFDSKMLQRLRPENTPQVVSKDSCSIS